MMATLKITLPDGRVARMTVPDGSGEDFIRSKVDALKAQMMAPAEQAPAPQAPQPEAPAAAPAPQMSAGETAVDAVKSLGSGLVRGGIGLASLPGLLESLGRSGLNKLGADVSPETATWQYNDIQRGVESVTGKLYEPKSTLGKYARTVGEFAPGVLFPGGLAQRVVGNVLAPAFTSETAGQLTEGTKAEPYARLAGGLLGGFIPNAATRIVSPVRTADPEHARQVALLRREGVRPTAGQATDSKALKWGEQVTGDIPLGPGTGGDIARAEQFTRAALRHAGVNAPRATAQVINDAFTNIGQRFDALAARTVMPLDQRLANDISAVVNQYNRSTGPAVRAPIVQEIADDVHNLVRSGANAANPAIAGDVYHRWTSMIEATARNADQYLAPALRQLRSALDDAVERALPAADRGQWRQVRGEYRNLLAITEAAGRAGEKAAKGLISPAALKGAMQHQNVRSYARGQRQLDQLARAGEGILRELPQSGTAPRAQAMALLSAPTTWTTGLSTGVGYQQGGIEGALMGLGGQAALARLLMSRPAQAWLANQAAAPVQRAVQGGQWAPVARGVGAVGAYQGASAPLVGSQTNPIWEGAPPSQAAEDERRRAAMLGQLLRQ